MKSKFLPIIVLLALVGLGWFISSNRSIQTASQQSAGATQGSASSAPNVGMDSAAVGGQTRIDGSVVVPGMEDQEGQQEIEILPAAKLYKSADEALAAIKKGALEYDDTILEQFTTPGDDCTFCPELYKNLKDLISSAGVPSEQLSFYGELLAISGRTENLQTLVDAIKSAQSNEAKEALAESLELTFGGAEVTKFLGNFLNDSDARIKEASVAALTNQGNRNAAELLYKAAVEKGDADGFYSMGIGLGEFVPDEDSIPYLQEQMRKGDKFSHLAVKALLNGGLPGLRTVVDTLSLSKDAAADKAMLEAASDHVSYDEETESYLTKIAAETKNPALKEFADKVLQLFKGQAEEDAANMAGEILGTGEAE